MSFKVDSTLKVLDNWQFYSKSNYLEWNQVDDISCSASMDEIMILNTDMEVPYLGRPFKINNNIQPKFLYG